MIIWQKLILYPLAIYAAVFLFISALIGFKVDQTGDWVWYVTTLISIVGFYIASRASGVKDAKEAITLGLVWIGVMVILDLVLTRPFTGWGYFMSWKTYFNYVLILIIPIVVSKIK